MDTKTFDLTGKTAVVTGASRGIGEAVARLLADWGAHVIVSSRKLDACEEVVTAIRQAGGAFTKYSPSFFSRAPKESPGAPFSTTMQEMPFGPEAPVRTMQT